MMTVGIPIVYQEDILMTAHILRIEYKNLHGYEPNYWVLSKSMESRIWASAACLQLRRDFNLSKPVKLSAFMGIPILHLDSIIALDIMALI